MTDHSTQPEHADTPLDTPLGTPIPPGDLPDGLTVFLGRRDRLRAVRALRRLDPDRARALLIALGLSPAQHDGGEG